MKTEVDLYIPVRDWYVSQGYVIHCEVFDTDIVVIKDDLMTAVELKKGMNPHAALQLKSRTLWADYVVAAMPSLPRSADILEYGIGILLVQNGKVSMSSFEPKRQPYSYDVRREHRFNILKNRVPSFDYERGGLPGGTEAADLRFRRRSSLKMSVVG